MSSLGGAVTKGAGLIVEIILLALSGQFVVAFVPSTLTGFATAALTSVNASVQTIFQQGLSLTFVAVIILLYIGVLAEAFRGY
jgi:ABC-type Na+ efflux pump permease subunit